VPRLLEIPTGRPAAPPPSATTLGSCHHATTLLSDLQRGEARLVPTGERGVCEESRGPDPVRPAREDAFDAARPNGGRPGRPPLRAGAIVDETVIRGQDRRTTM